LNVAIAPLIAADFPTVAGWLADSSTNEWLTSDWRGRPVDPSIIAITTRNKKNRLWLVRCDGRPAGLVGLSDIDAGDGIANVWYILGEPELAGKGVTAEAVRQMVRLAFAELGLESVHAWAMENNIRSRRVLERAGFREAGRLRSAATYRGQRVDRIYFDIVKSEANR
jgi:RimJ/RimL family protein N-acetyltransferase